MLLTETLPPDFAQSLKVDLVLGITKVVLLAGLLPDQRRLERCPPTSDLVDLELLGVSWLW